MISIMNADVIVVGAGFSGLVAAATASEEGKRVLLIAQGQGSTAITSGCIDILGYLPCQKSYLTNIQEGLQELIVKSPEHPYAKVGLETIRKAVISFKKITDNMGYGYSGDGVTNYLVPTPIGSPRPTALIPKTMVAGNILEEGEVVVVGFDRLLDFFPKLIADRINLFRKRLKLSGSWRSARVNLGLGKVVTPHRLAKWLDLEENFEKLMLELKPVASTGAVIGLPAVLGTAYSAEIFNRLQNELKCRIFEIPSGSPTVTGLRLYSLLCDYAKESGVEIRFGHSVSSIKEGLDNKYEVIINNFGRASRALCNNVVIATGGFYGKGLTSSHEKTFESLMDLSLTFSERDYTLSEKLLTPELHSKAYHGVLVNRDLNPNIEGDRVQKNITVVGRTLANYDPVLENSGLGVALATGYTAGNTIVEVEQNERSC